MSLPNTAARVVESMKQAFVSVASSYVGCCVGAVLRNQGYKVVGSVRPSDTEDFEGLVSQTTDIDDDATTAQLAVQSDVVVLCLLEDLRGVDAVLTSIRRGRDKAAGLGRPSHLLLLSTTMTWAHVDKQPSVMATNPAATTSTKAAAAEVEAPTTTAAADEGWPQGRETPTLLSRTASPNDSCRTTQTPPLDGSNSGTARSKHSMTEEDYMWRTPPTGHLEHKRLEAMALNLRSRDLSVCIIGAGVPYGLGEGPLFRTFREIWRESDGPAPMPTSTHGDNLLSLIHVVDLSNAIGVLLRPGEHDSPPPSFPRPYILAVEGDDAQCTTKELVTAIGQGLGRSAETRPIPDSELEDILVDDPGAMSLLIDVRFSNQGGILSEMASSGKWRPIAWSTGFVASADLVARDFVVARSLSPFKAVVLGPPGGDQGHVCKQISQKYGMVYVDTKVSIDGVFQALGKPLPEPPSAEAKAPPHAKGTKGTKGTKGAKDKNSKKGDKGKDKGKFAPEALAGLEGLTPMERLFHDIQTAFEDCNVPMAEYSTLDSGKLARALPAPLVAKSARLFLEKTRARWSRSGFILCDIPSHRDAATELFSPPLVSSDPNGYEDPSGSNDQSIPVRPSASNPDAKDFHPTHVVYLDASLLYLLEKRGKSTVDGKIDLAKATEELERYFLVERGQPEPELGGRVLTEDGQAQAQEGNDEMHSSNARYCQISMTARMLRDDYGAQARAIDAERDVSTFVDEVKLFLTGGDAVPEWVRMLSDDTDDYAVEASINEQMDPRAANASELVANPESEQDSLPKSTEDEHAALMKVLASLSTRDATDVETRTRRHRRFLTAEVVPQVASGLMAAAEARTEDPIEFLADYLIRAGKTLQTRTEAEAALKYQAGLALLRELELRDTELNEIC